MLVAEGFINRNFGTQAYTTHPTFRKNTPVLKIAKSICDKFAKNK